MIRKFEPEQENERRALKYWRSNTSCAKIELSKEWRESLRNLGSRGPNEPVKVFSCSDLS